MAGPLAHLRVVDLTDLRGALAARVLGDLGADVLKVEPASGDPGRLRGPFAGDAVAPDARCRSFTGTRTSGVPGCRPRRCGCRSVSTAGSPRRIF
jgi:crotonobetainyl-CoA:carnitine CoA-transferase CaiB-like acyl-CoA transferase